MSSMQAKPRPARGVLRAGLIALAIGLVAPLGARAQIYGGGGYFGGGGSMYGTSLMGTVRGTVQGLDFNRGLVTVRTNGEQLALHARPQDLSGLNPGDIAELTYLNYDGMLWLEPGGYYGGGFGTYGIDTFALSGEVTGTVESVDRRTGQVRVADQTLRAHPEQLDGVYPGSFVSFSYAQIGDVRWVEDVGGYYGGGVGSGFIGGGSSLGTGDLGTGNVGGFGNQGIP